MEKMFLSLSLVGEQTAANCDKFRALLLRLILPLRCHNSCFTKITTIKRAQSSVLLWMFPYEGAINSCMQW